jgi:hypothetical protein
VSSSDEFNDPFSEDAGGGLLEMEGGRNIQDAKIAKVKRGLSYGLKVIRGKSQRSESRRSKVKQEAASSLAPQNLEQDAPRTDWDRMSQLR